MISGLVTGRHTCSFIRLPCWLTMRICDVLTTSHFFFLCVLNNVVSHVMGQKARRTKPTSAEEAETNGIKCFSTHFCCSSLSYLKKCPSLSSRHWQNEIPRRRRARLSARCPQLRLQKLSTWIYIFIYTDDSAGRAECCSSVLAEEKIKLLCSRTGSSQKPDVVYRWIMFMTLDYF